MNLPLLSVMAYLDPGSGSFLIQLLIAGFFGALFMIKMYWGKIKARFRHDQQPSDDNKPESQ